MSLTRDDVISYLEGLSGEDLGKLAEELLARLGMPPIATLAPRSTATLGATTATMGTAPELEVVLRNHGTDKLAVIVLVRKLLGAEIGLTRARELVESAPVVLCEGLSRAEAKEIADALRRAGADVELR